MLRRETLRTLKRGLGRIENQSGWVEPGGARSQEERHELPSA
jgi:hypothetical protein